MTPTLDLRYPIGKASPVTKLEPSERSARIDMIAALPSELEKAVEGLTDAQLDTPYRPEGWTVRQTVHHLADSHMNALTRLKLALTEDKPTLKPYDEKLWAELADASLPIEPSLAIVRAVHERWTTLLRSLEDQAFARLLVHPENGELTVDRLLEIYSWHGRHHVAHITGLRQRSGF
ncbi:MAG TPA: putative metal-dependent hydrolase [Bryobacteraceae bacterium]|nr:putative metal-dependent hydrolase [Bryobacteraceae bacterium]